MYIISIINWGKFIEISCINVVVHKNCSQYLHISFIASSSRSIHTHSTAKRGGYRNKRMGLKRKVGTMPD